MIPCSISRRIVLNQRGCTQDGRPEVRSGSATLPLTSGTAIRTGNIRRTLRQRNCSAASLPRISWRALSRGIPNIAGIYPRLRNRRSIHVKQQILKKYPAGIPLCPKSRVKIKETPCGYPSMPKSRAEIRKHPAGIPLYPKSRVKIKERICLWI